MSKALTRSAKEFYEFFLDMQRAVRQFHYNSHHDLKKRAEQSDPQIDDEEQNNLERRVANIQAVRLSAAEKTARIRSSVDWVRR